jgi:16S rRNA (cytosine967-C5)-methyltransferase
VNQPVHEVVAEVIRRASKTSPASAVLRETLRQQRSLPPAGATAVAKAVFAYYRWHAWLQEEQGLESKIALALRLDERFRGDPGSVPLAQLRANAAPAWVAECLDVSDDWVCALQREPKLWLRAKRGAAQALAAKLPGAELTPLLPDALLYRGNRDLFRTPEFHAGEFEIQDLSSQLVGHLCAPRPGETWWDACAGEGGKTLLLSELMQNKGLIWASDRAEWRLKHLKRRAARARMFNYRMAPWDGGPRLPTKTKFDGVLVDAPCSCIGTWQRDPYARWVTSTTEVRELAEVQRQMLAHVAPSVKPGGKLVFAVCTMSRAETTEIAETFAAAHPDFRPLILPDIQFKHRTVRGASSIMVWPCDLDANGMFIAAWQRTKN